MKILLGDFNVRLGRENILKLATGNESLHQDCNDNDVRIVNFTTPKTYGHEEDDVPTLKHSDIHLDLS